MKSQQVNNNQPLQNLTTVTMSSATEELTFIFITFIRDLCTRLFCQRSVPIDPKIVCFLHYKNSQADDLVPSDLANV